MAHLGIFAIVISEFSHQQQLSLVVLFVVDKGLEIILYYAILPFGLHVSLGWEGYRNSWLDACELT